MNGLLEDNRIISLYRSKEDISLESAQTLCLGRRVAFQAVCPQRNVFRFYTIDIDRDLFGDVVICTHYGRIGTHGVIRKYWPKDPEETQKILRRLIQKRLNSEKRCGCQYKQVG